MTRRRPGPFGFIHVRVIQVSRPFPVSVVGGCLGLAALSGPAPGGSFGIRAEPALTLETSLLVA
ncbi:MAG: hypothetical protein RIQ93_1332 [Verrucomicrobiota bacterium]|jgi:hypothetical protein